MGAPHHGQEAGAVLQAQGDVVARLQAGGAEHVGQPVGLGIELGVGDDLSRAGHDDGRAVGVGGGEVSGVHGGNVPLSGKGPSLGRR